MKTDKDDLQTKYQTLVSEYNKLIDENRTLYEIKNDTIAAIEIFKKLQDESIDREKSYQIQIAKLQSDKRNLHKDRSRLTKQLLSKHRDMIILNSEIDKFRDVDDYESKWVEVDSWLDLEISNTFHSSDQTAIKTHSNPSNLWCIHRPLHHFYVPVVTQILPLTPSPLTLEALPRKWCELVTSGRMEFKSLPVH